MTARLAGMQPQKAVRIAGFLYLVIIAGGVFAEVFVRQRVFVPGDPAATARNILEHEWLYRLGFAVHLFYLACALPLALIFYELFRRADRTTALLALFFNLTAIAIESVVLLAHFAPLHILTPAYSSAFSEQQLAGWAYTSLRSFATGFGVSLVFFGFSSVLVGRLIFRSGFLPRALGVLMAVAGLCYLISSFSVFVAPGFAGRLFPYILVPCLIAELSLALWLLVRGVDARKWELSSRMRTRGNVEQMRARSTSPHQDHGHAGGGDVDIFRSSC